MWGGWCSYTCYDKKMWGDCHGRERWNSDEVLKVVNLVSLHCYTYLFYVFIFKVSQMILINDFKISCSRSKD
jgi:hypothetical protein